MQVSSDDAALAAPQCLAHPCLAQLPPTDRTHACDPASRSVAPVCTADKTWKVLEDAIREIHNQNASGLSFEELYRCV
jgi:hypothetical protein